MRKKRTEEQKLSEPLTLRLTAGQMQKVRELAVWSKRQPSDVARWLLARQLDGARDAGLQRAREQARLICEQVLELSDTVHGLKG